MANSTLLQRSTLLGGLLPPSIDQDDVDKLYTKLEKIHDLKAALME